MSVRKISKEEDKQKNKEDTTEEKNDRYVKMDGNEDKIRQRKAYKGKVEEGEEIERSERLKWRR